MRSFTRLKARFAVDPNTKRNLDAGKLGKGVKVCVAGKKTRSLVKHGPHFHIPKVVSRFMWSKARHMS